MLGNSRASVLKDRPKTEEHKTKIAKALIGNQNPKGSKKTPETRAKMSLSLSGSNNYGFGNTAMADRMNDIKASCFYCHKIMNVGNIKRWHSDNCKERKT